MMMEKGRLLECQEYEEDTAVRKGGMVGKWDKRWERNLERLSGGKLGWKMEEMLGKRKDSTKETHSGKLRGWRKGSMWETVWGGTKGCKREGKMDVRWEMMRARRKELSMARTRVLPKETDLANSKD
jgi:hypothetical protein